MIVSLDRLKSLEGLLESQKAVVREVKERVTVQLLASSSQPDTGPQTLAASEMSTQLSSAVNHDPDVRTAVSRLIELKQAVAAAADALGNAKADIAIRERRDASSRMASIRDAFGPSSGDGASITRIGGAVAAVSTAEVSAWDSVGAAEVGDTISAAGNTVGSATVSGSVNFAAPGSFSLHDVDDSSEAPSSLEEAFKVSATWQLPPDPLFFEADRQTVKALAKAVVEWLLPTVTSSRW